MDDLRPLLQRTFAFLVLVGLGGGVFPASPPMDGENARPREIAAITSIENAKLAFFPGGRYLAVAGYEFDTEPPIGLLIVYDLDAKKEVFRSRELNAAFTDVAVSRQGDRFAATYFSHADFSRKVMVWSFPAGRLERVLTGRNYFRRLAFSPDGRQILFDNVDQFPVLYLQDFAGDDHDDFRGAEQPILSTAISPKGDWVAAGELNGTISIWQRKDVKFLGAAKVSEDGVSFLAFASDGKRLFFGLRSGDIGSLTIGQPAAKRLLSANADRTESVHGIGLARDDRILLTGGFLRPADPKAAPLGKVDLWDFATGKRLARWTGMRHPIAVSSDGRRLATGMENSNVIKVLALPGE